MTTKTLRLFPSDFDALQTLAGEVGALAPTGPNAGRPSWRSLLREIARGSVEVSWSERVTGDPSGDKEHLEQRTVRYPLADFAALQALAVRLGTLAPTGPAAGEPSWRSLVKLIARGDLEIWRVDGP